MCEILWCELTLPWFSFGRNKERDWRRQREDRFYPEIAFKSISISFLQNNDLFQRNEDATSSYQKFHDIEIFWQIRETYWWLNNPAIVKKIVLLALTWMKVLIWRKSNWRWEHRCEKMVSTRQVCIGSLNPAAVSSFYATLLIISSVV